MIWAPEGHLSHVGGNVLHGAVPEELSGHPLGVFLPVGGVDHHQIGPLMDLVDDEVVHAAPASLHMGE